MQEKRKLHRGGPRTLNLYISGGGPRGTPILGWARFPWQYAAAPKLDSVTVNVAGMRGGSARGYNLGDTVIHETGHWLGLYHTFQGGCGGGGDLVADTPAEAEPSFGCDNSRDTCAADPGQRPGAQLHGLLTRRLHDAVHRRPGPAHRRGVREMAVGLA